MKIYITILFFLIPKLFFGQSELENYLKQASDNNPSLKASYKNYEMALQRVPQVKSLSNPTITVAYGLSPIETRLGPQQAKLSVMQMFPWFGTLDVKGKQSALMAEAALENYSSERNRLIFEVKTAYYSLFFTEKSIEYTQKQIEIFDRLERQATIKFESNQTGMLNVLRFQMEKDEFQAKIELLNDQKHKLSVQFNLLLNRETNLAIELVDSLFFPEGKLFSTDSLLKNNPKLKAFDAVSASADFQIRASQLSGYPQIGIGLDYVFIGNPAMKVDNGGKDAIMPMISVSIPLYRKKYKAKIKESQLRKEQVIYQKEALENTLLSQYEKGMQDYKNALRNLKLYENLLSKTNQVLNILKTDYETSGKDYEQVLEMQNSLLKYQINYEKALTDLYKTVAYLEFLTSN